MSPATSAFLVLAGVVAGIVGTGGGITSLVSYPALLAVGLPLPAADVANLVALVACWPGSAHRSTVNGVVGRAQQSRTTPPRGSSSGSGA